MLKTYKQPSIVSGMSISDIINMDINKFMSLKESDLKKVVGRLVSAGNKRLRTFEKRGISSPATRYIVKSGGYFSVKGKNINELRKEYARAKGFFESKTGTIKGYEEVKKETIETFKKQNVTLTPEQFEKMWEAYEDLKEVDPSVSNKKLKYRVLDEITEMVDKYDVEMIVEKMSNKVSKIYEKMKEIEKESENGGVSEFFPI
jgi:uncharacterized coiled-coil protein SlyX